MIHFRWQFKLIFKTDLILWFKFPLMFKTHPMIQVDLSVALWPCMCMFLHPPWRKAFTCHSFHIQYIFMSLFNDVTSDGCWIVSLNVWLFAWLCGFDSVYSGAQLMYEQYSNIDCLTFRQKTSKARSVYKYKYKCTDFLPFRQKIVEGSLSW